MISGFEVTIASGTNTFYTTEKQLTGRIHAIKYEFGDMENTLDLTITGEKTGVPILQQDNIPAADKWFYPRALVVDGSDLTNGAAGTDAFVGIHIIEERIKIVTAQGGSGKAGTITIFIDDGR